MKQTMITTLISWLAILSLSFFFCIGLNSSVVFHWVTFMLLFKIIGIVGIVALLGEYILFTYKIDKEKK